MRSTRVARVVCPAAEAFDFERVTGGLGGSFEGDRRLVGATGALEEVAADREQAGVVSVVFGQKIQEGESGVRPIGHADGDGASDPSRGRRPDREQRSVEGCDLDPVGLLDRRCLSVQGGDCCLELERSGLTESAGSFEERGASIDQVVVPGGAYPALTGGNRVGNPNWTRSRTQRWKQAPCSSTPAR